MREVRLVIDVPDRVVDLLERFVIVMEDTYDATLRPKWQVEENEDDEVEDNDAD